MRLRLLLGAALGIGAAVALPLGCGARTTLEAPSPPDAAPVVRSADFCAGATYDAGFSDISLFLLLDSSLSMDQDRKWDFTTAAIGAFVDAPSASGIGVGLGFFPHGVVDCADDDFAKPAVPVAILPANGPRLRAALAARQPSGETPTLPALRAAIEYARAARLGDPTRRMSIALVTDGAPNACDSTADAVAAAAREGATTAPQVLTFVIGLETGYQDVFRQIATAGGTGAPILIGRNGDTSAQQIVDALESVRAQATSCHFAVPATPREKPSADDIGVNVSGPSNIAPRALPRVADAAACPTDSEAYYVDDAADAKGITLCPATCTSVHAVAGSTIEVVAGCGAGGPTDGGAPIVDGGACSPNIDFVCVAACGDATSTNATCSDGEWICPPGTVTSTSCTTCPAVPHGCCKEDGTIGVASCIDGAWVCPPGASLFGQGTCVPPGACAPTLPCSVGQVCVYADHACGAVDLGTCKDPSLVCAGAPQAVCGCDGGVHQDACKAAADGVDLTFTSHCDAPPGTFGCGPLFCPSDQLCVETRDLAVQFDPIAYACEPLPQGCATGCGCHLCPCPQGRTCTESCTPGPTLSCSSL